MIRFFRVVMLLCVVGCADSSPESKEALEKSRKTTGEAEKKLIAIQKSTDESRATIEAIQQNPPAPADVK